MTRKITDQCTKIDFTPVYCSITEREVLSSREACWWWWLQHIIILPLMSNIMSYHRLCLLFPKAPY